MITNSRWLAYATAGAASAFSCANAVEASIHYSGIIGEYLGSSCEDKSARFQLDQPGDSFRLRHSLAFGCTASYGGYAHFGVLGLAGASVAGFYCPSNPQVVNYRVRLDHSEFVQGKNGEIKAQAKYLGAPGSGNRLFFPPGITVEQLAGDILFPERCRRSIWLGAS